MQLFLIVAVVLGVFTPSLFGGFCSVDDLEMIRSLEKIEKIDIFSVFFPQTDGGLYYRPLIGLSFLFDRFVLGLDPFYMHIHNVVIHLLNTIVLYFLAREILVVVGERSTSWFPTLVSLLFALHPVVTESVNWISGRTDLLAGYFILLSALLSLKYLRVGRSIFFTLSLLLVVPAVFVKETSFAFLPCIFLVVFCRMRAENRFINVSKLKVALYLLGGGGVAVACFFLLRLFVFSSSSSRIGMTVNFVTNDPIQSCFVFLRAFGFYIKKLVMPYPLNFAILEVDPLYEILATIILLLFIYALYKFSVVSVLFAMSVIMFVPSFVIAMNQIAWTPYAERYLYISSAFFVLALSFYFRNNLVIESPVLKTILVAGLLVCAGGVTLQRNHVWGDSERLCADTVHKSPDSIEMRLLYGSLLAEKGDFAGSLHQYWMARAIPTFGYDVRPDIHISNVYKKQGELDKAIRVMRMAVVKSNGNSKASLQGLAGLLSSRIDKASSHSERINFAEEISRLNSQLSMLKSVN